MGGSPLGDYPHGGFPHGGFPPRVNPPWGESNPILASMAFRPSQGQGIVHRPNRTPKVSRIPISWHGLHSDVRVEYPGTSPEGARRYSEGITRTGSEATWSPNGPRPTTNLSRTYHKIHGWACSIILRIGSSPNMDRSELTLRSMTFPDCRPYLLLGSMTF